MIERLIIAGQGGQGALRIGQMIAYAAMNEGKEATWLPSYGAEMRGGTSNCSVILSDRRIATPIVTAPDVVIAMNEPSLLKFQPAVAPGGTLIYNSDMVDRLPTRADIELFAVPADGIAEAEGNPRGANMVLLGAYLALSSTVSQDEIMKNIRASFSGAKAKYAEPNCRLVERGMQVVISR